MTDLYVLLSVDNAKFRQMVYPDSLIRIESTLLRDRKYFFVFETAVYLVDEKNKTASKVAEATIKAKMGPPSLNKPHKENQNDSQNSNN